MSLVVANRVQETCTSPGIGAVTLLGADIQYVAFSSKLANGDTTFYVIADQSGANWEVGIGTFATAGNTLARTTVLSSSNAGSLVNFSSGTQKVWNDYPAEYAIYSSNNASQVIGQTLISGGVGVSPAWGNATMVYPAAGIANSTGTAWGSSLTAPSGAIVGTTGVQTLTNKRVTPRVLALSANSATPAINTDSYDFVDITSQTAAITSFTSGLTGTATDGQKLWIAITGTAAVAITWGASFEASTTALPTTTVTTARLDIGLIWDAATSKWRCIAVA